MSTSTIDTPHAIAQAADEALAVWAQSDDDRGRDARAELTERYQPLVLHRARQQRHQCDADVDNAVSVAQIGLQKAINHFDPDRGRHFAAYAPAKVEGELRNWHRDNRYQVHVPRPLHEQHMRVRAAQAMLTTPLGRPPSVDEVAAELQISSNDVLAALAVASAERRRTAELGAALCPADPDNVELLEALTHLPERDRQILHRRYWLDQTQTEVARALSLSQPQVSRLERRACGRLRAMLS